MSTLQSVKNHSSPRRLPPSAKEPLVMSEAEYGKVYSDKIDQSLK